MRETPYYSVRTGLNDNAKFDLAFLRRVFFDTFKFMRQNDYFQEAFGFYCVDQGEVSGLLGSEIEAFIRLNLRKDGLWPVDHQYSSYTEDDVFDMVEFFHDVVAKPVDGRYHSFSGCGWHYDTFDSSSGRSEFRGRMNAVLRDYADGFQLSEQGEIQALGAGNAAPA